MPMTDMLTSLWIEKGKLTHISHCRGIWRPLRRAGYDGASALRTHASIYLELECRGIRYRRMPRYYPSSPGIAADTVVEARDDGKCHHIGVSW
jgi:hypothetical protein